jgi:hypothetical protein
VVKEFDPEDPMELVGVAIPEGDDDLALDGIVQEYLFMGWNVTQIMFLFTSPYYGATHQIYERKGSAYVTERVHHLASQWADGWIREGGK